MTEFETWAEDIITTYGLERSSQLDRSYRYVLAANITTLKQTSFFRSKHYFYLIIKTACAKEIAGGVMGIIRDEQRAEVEAIKQAAALKKTQEATVLAEASASANQTIS